MPAPSPALARRPWFWVAIVILAVVALLPRLLSHPGPPPRLPVLGRLPAFELTDQAGRPFGSAELRGHVWVADFIFTRCPSACPRLTALLKRIQHRAGDARAPLRLVSFTIDPVHDTPPVLATYARQHGATRDWSFLTGSNDDLERTIVRGFKVSTGREDEVGPSREQPIPAQRLAEIFHGTHLVLVDAALRIRGYYASDDDDVAERIVADAQRVSAGAR